MKAVRHTGIVVRDLGKMRDFYRNLLGLRVQKDKSEAGDYADTICGHKGVKVRTVKLSAEDGGLVELLHFDSPAGKETGREIWDMGYTHMSFTVEDIEGLYKRLEARGISFNSRPTLAPDGRARVTFCRDPEGNMIELVEEIT